MPLPRGGTVPTQPGVHILGQQISMLLLNFNISGLSPFARKAKLMGSFALV